jgi:hypothetical protein
LQFINKERLLHSVNQREVGFEILTPVVTESFIFWDIKPCRPPEVNWRFRGTGRRISLARNQHEGRRQAVHGLYSYTLKNEATYSSEMAVDIQRATLLYIRGDKNLPK